MHNCIQSTQEICNPYSTFSKIEENLLNKIEGENSHSVSPLDSNASLPPPPRKRVSTREKIKSIFKRSFKERKEKKEQNIRASSDTEMLERVDFESMYAQIEKHPQFQKQMLTSELIQSQLSPETQNKSLKNTQEYHSDPLNTQHNIQITEKRRTRKKLLTRAQRSINSSKHAAATSSSSGEEKESSSTSRASRKQKSPPTLAKRNFNEGSLQELFDKEHPCLDFPSPPAYQSFVKSQLEKSENASPPQSMKLPKIQDNTSTPVKSSAKDTIVEAHNEPMLFSQEPKITIMKLKTHSSESENPELVSSTMSKPMEEMYHPKKIHSVGSSPSPIKICENNFIFDVSKVPFIIQPKDDAAFMTQGIHYNVATKKTPSERQPYVNMVQVVNSNNHASKIVTNKINIHESRVISAPENINNIHKDKCQVDVVMTKTPSNIHAKEMMTDENKRIPLRPVKPPPLTPLHIESETKIQNNEEQTKGNLKLKSSLKSVKLKDESLSPLDNITLINTANNSNSKKNKESSPNLKHSQRVNFGKTTEIPITPTLLPDNSEKSFTMPRQNEMRYRAYNEEQYGYPPVDQYYWHSRHASDSLMYERGYQAPTMYHSVPPTSMHSPNMMVPHDSEYGPYCNPYYQEEMQYNKFQQPYGSHLDYSMVPHPYTQFYPQPPQMMPYQHNYVYRPQQYNEMLRYSTPSASTFRPNRPAPAPPSQHHPMEVQKRIIAQNVNEPHIKGKSTNTIKYETIV